MEEQLYTGVRGDRFISFLKSILEKSKIKKKYFDKLLTEDSLKIYDMAFTAKSYNEESNYEFFEQLGDVSINKSVVWYMYERFPQLKTTEGVPIVARLRINYVSKESLSNIANDLGFWDFISGSVEDRGKKKKSLLEDTFESFIGATEYILDNYFKTTGVGYNIIYTIIKNIFDNKNISLKYEDLYDAKTRLKELFDMRDPNTGETIGQIKYKSERVQDDTLTQTTITWTTKSNAKYIIGVGRGSIKSSSEQNAAKEGLKYMKSQGFVNKKELTFMKFNQSI